MLSRSTTLLLTLALGSLTLGGCTVVTTDDQGDGGTTTGSATVTTGSTSTGSTVTTSSTGSTATTTTGTSNSSTGSTSTTGATTGATAGVDAAACLGDGDPDASSAAGDAAATPCNSLSYATSACPAADDSGALTPPVGKALCDYMADHARPQVFAALLTCLEGQELLHTPCSAEHEQSVSDCLGNVFSQACDAPGVTLDGSSYDCTKLTTQCAAEGTDAGTAVGDAAATSDGAPTDDAATTDDAASADAATTADGGATADAGASTPEASSPADAGTSTTAGGLSEATCKRYANGLTTAARADLFACFAAKGPADGTCTDRFIGCFLAY